MLLKAEILGWFIHFLVNLCGLNKSMIDDRTWYLNAQKIFGFEKNITPSTKDNKVDVSDICCPLFPNDPSNHKFRIPGYIQLNMSMSNTGQCSQSLGDLSSTTSRLIEFLLISNLVPPRIVTCYSRLAWHRSMERAIIIYHNLGL